MRDTPGVHPGQAPSPPDPIRILIADDDRLFARMLRTRLNVHPHLEIVGIAGDGSKAVSLVEELEPDLVVMDVNMPVLDGIDATRRMRTLPRAPKVVLITGEDDDFGTRPYEVGADAYLRKSVELVSLIDVIVAVSQVIGAPSRSVATRLSATLGREAS
jgi:DNA-binding NarL/FixJ family response regulator